MVYVILFSLSVSGYCDELHPVIYHFTNPVSTMVNFLFILPPGQMLGVDRVMLYSASQSLRYLSFPNFDGMFFVFVVVVFYAYTAKTWGG